MKKLLVIDIFKLSLLSLLISLSINASDSEAAIQIVKPVLVKNMIDKSIAAGKWLANNQPIKFLADNKVTNTFTKDEYVQKVWADKLGKATLIAASFYMIAFSKMALRPKKGCSKNYRPNNDKQINDGFSALNWLVLGAIVHATTYAYLTK